MKKEKYNIDNLIEIMRILRSEKGCPWDKKQDHNSLKKYLIEETYEAIEAIDLNDKDKMKEELGDVLLQVIFHSQIGSENNTFNFEDVVNSISKKLVDRHPHVFGEAEINDADKVVETWEKIKKKEKGFESHSKVLKDVPKYLPSLMRGYKVQQKAAQVGFDWTDIKDVLNKVNEEKSELEEAIEIGEINHIEEEFGDVIFSLVNLARFLKVDPEISMLKTIDKFINRFEYLESESLKDGKNIVDMSLSEMDEYWEKAKKYLKEK